LRTAYICKYRVISDLFIRVRFCTVAPSRIIHIQETAYPRW